MRKILLSSLFFIALLGNVCAKTYEIKSPDGTIVIKIEAGDRLSWSAEKNGINIIPNTTIAMQLRDEVTFGINPVVSDTEEETVNETIVNYVPTKSKNILNHYNGLKIEFEEDYALEFRVFDDGFAYRFIYDYDENIIVESETMDITFGDNYSTYFPKEEKISHYESYYFKKSLKEIPADEYCITPMVVEVNDNIKILIADADLFDYPKLFLQGTAGNELTAKFHNKIKEIRAADKSPDRNETIISEHNYIAETNGERNFPWRAFVVTNDDADLLTTDMVFKLSRECEIEDPSWIKPGKIAWDWWNANNIYGVDFKSGLNLDTYKYYIDFASKYGMEYIILDEGWSVSTTDLSGGNPNLDVEELIKYGKSKNVGIILWTLWKPLYNNLENYLDTFKKWGAVGVKVDFMQRSDQDMVNIYEKITAEAAKREMFVDFHGAYQPAGLRRAYPNLLNYEGVKGLENVKWSDLVTPEHDVILTFIRMATGPMDYTPGAMVNKNKINYAISFERPMSMGTRCHQVSMYVLYESPLQMLADTPTNYMKEEETTKFIAQFPTVWDTTVVKEAEIGEYLVVAKKNADKWYLGAMTNSKARNLEITLDFLPEGNYSLEMMEDGINCDRFAEDYKHSTIDVKSGDKIKMNLAVGGGWAGIFTKK